MHNMPSSNNSSFIPKHSPNRPERKNSPRQVFIGTIIVRVVFFATLLAAFGTFVYDRKVQADLGAEIERFRIAAVTFDEDAAKLAEIVAFDARLAQANTLRSQAVSTVTLLRSIERATAESVQIVNLEVTRESPETLLLAAEVQTDTFDSTIFQRSVLNESEVLGAAVIEDVQVSLETLARDEAGETSELVEDTKGVTFVAMIEIDPASIPALAEANDGIVPLLPKTETTSSASPGSAASVGVGFDNQE
jgi:hypothetical protein